MKQKRTEKSLSTHKLAELSGVSQSYISHVENGRKDVPSPEIIRKLSRALDDHYIELMVAAGYWNEDDLLEPLPKIKDETTESIVELLKFLSMPNITYKDKFLSEEDRKRILDMLNILFPDR